MGFKMKKDKNWASFVTATTLILICAQNFLANPTPLNVVGYIFLLMELLYILMNMDLGAPLT